MKELIQEWLALQKQTDDYEKYSLLIKLFNIMIVVFAFSYSLPYIVTFVIVAIVWLQDGIWKTFQSRTEQRIMKLEQGIAEFEEGKGELSILPFQLNRQFRENRASTVGLLTEYFKQSLRPTVAFPHLFLLLLSGYLFMV